MANTTIIQQSGINFTVDNRTSQYTGWSKKYSHAANISGSTYPNPDAVDETTGVTAFGINAVEIDWNGATPGIGEETIGIQTTGELLSLIKAIPRSYTH